MSKANQLRNEQRAYYSLLENVSSFNSKLKKAYNQLENAIKINASLLIDGESADNREITNSRNEIKSTSDYLTSTIIPAINYKINILNRDIAIAEQEEG